ncbi:hypothetical protein QTP88_021671 [Uroleucon formosanum]
MNIASHSAQTNKRNLSSSSNSASEPSTPNPNKNIILTNHKKKIFVTRNRFEVFAQDDSFETNTNENIPNSHQTNTNTDANTFTKPPPPIFVKGVEDYPELCTTLIELIGVDNFMYKSTTNSLKIQTTDPSAYRALIQFLKTEKAEYHTYQLNEDKPLRVVIRNLHSSTPLTLIKEELEVRCFEVRQVTNVLHKVNKNPLPLFFIDLEPTLQSNEIFQLSSLLHCKINVEEPYKPKQISQCFNCQQYGHTRGYCGYHPRCVRCGADHQSSACPNSRDVPPKCVHCSQNHPANYKGCSIYKELQRRKIPSAPSNRIDNNYKTKSTNVQGSHPPSHAHSNPQTQTYAQATSNISANDTSPPINATHPPDLNKLMSNFLDEFKTLINPLIALLTKTHFTKYTYIHIPGYTLIKTNHPDNTAHGGAAIFVKSTIEFYPLPSFSQDFLQSCAINLKINNTPITIAAIYSPPKHIVTDIKFSDYFSTFNNYFIIGGDFNAKHQSWGCRVNNPRGVTLYNFTNLKKFKVLAPPDPTYWPSSSRKNPDILDIFVTKIPNNLFSTTKNLLDLNSDHSSVLLTLNTSPTYKESNKLFNKYTDHSKFTELVDKEIHLNIKLKTPDDIDLAIHNLTNVIQTAAWSATSTFLALPTSDPLPVTIRNKIVEKRRARALFQRTRLPSHKLNYNNLANSLKKMLAKIKANVWQNHLMKLTPKDGSLWRETKQILRYKSPNLPIKKSDGSLAISDFEKAELFKEHLSQTFQPHSEIIDNENMNTVETFLNASLPLTLPVKSFIPNDVKYAILKYSLNKSPGYDRITAEVARSLPTRAIVHITHIFNASLRLSYFPLLWKFSTIILFPKPNKPPDIPSSHRPISLLPFFAKILERLILKRIIPIVTQKNILPNTQFGFRASHSTTHQVHRVVDAISYSLEKKLYCNCVFLDIAQAFDRVWHDGLLYKLKKFLPPTYYLLIKSYLTDRFFQVRHGSALSDLASINAGVPQGGILSPILYNIFASDQPITPNTSVADFADDKALISINNNPILASINLQTHLNAMEKWFTKWRFKVNQNKSVHTTFTLRHTPCPGVVLYGIPIPYSPKIKYLGLTLDQRLTWAHHIRTKRLALNHRLRLLKPLLSNNNHTSLRTKLLIYKTLLKPLWTYGLQLWGNAKKTNILKIQTFQNIVLRKLANAPPYVSNHTLHTDLKLNKINDEAKIFYKRFYYRLNNHPNQLIKNLATPTIPGNPPRRLKRKWCRDLLN